MLQINYVYHMRDIDIYDFSKAIGIPIHRLYTKYFSLNGGYICHNKHYRKKPYLLRFFCHNMLRFWPAAIVIAANGVF